MVWGDNRWIRWLWDPWQCVDSTPLQHLQFLVSSNIDVDSCEMFLQHKFKIWILSCKGIGLIYASCVIWCQDIQYILPGLFLQPPAVTPFCHLPWYNLSIHGIFPIRLGSSLAVSASKWTASIWVKVRRKSL